MGEGAHRERPGACRWCRRTRRRRAGRAARPGRRARAPMSPGRAHCRCAGVEFAEQRRRAARVHAPRAAPRRRARHPVQEFAQDGHRREAAVGGGVRAEQLGRARWRPGAARPRGARPTSASASSGGGLVGVGGAAVEVEVVAGGGVAERDHHVERLVAGRGRRPRRPRRPPRPGPPAPGGTATRRPAASGARVLPAPGGPTASSPVPSSAGSRAMPEPRYWYGLRSSWIAAADPDLAAEQVVGGAAAPARRGRPTGGRTRRRRPAAARCRRTRRRPRAVRARCPGAPDPDAVDVVHPPGAHLLGEPVGGGAAPRDAQLRPVGGAPRVGRAPCAADDRVGRPRALRCRGRAGPGPAAPPAPARRPAARPGAAVRESAQRPYFANGQAISRVPGSSVDDHRVDVRRMSSRTEEAAAVARKAGNSRARS